VCVSGDKAKGSIGRKKKTEKRQYYSLGINDCGAAEAYQYLIRMGNIRRRRLAGRVGRRDFWIEECLWGEATPRDALAAG
jgi:hypothetical protein